MNKIKVLQIGGNTQKNGITTYLLNTFKRLKDEYEFIFLNTAFRESNKEVENEISFYGGKIIHLPYSREIEDIEEKKRLILKKIKTDDI